MRVAALFVLFGVALAASEFGGADVVTLTSANFDEKVEALAQLVMLVCADERWELVFYQVLCSLVRCVWIMLKMG